VDTVLWEDSPIRSVQEVGQQVTMESLLPFNQTPGLKWEEDELTGTEMDIL
jgi:hypothetical protein